MLNVQLNSYHGCIKVYSYFDKLMSRSWAFMYFQISCYKQFKSILLNNNNNNKVILYSAITMQIYSTSLLEKSSMLGTMPGHLPSNVQWNNWHLCVRKSLHKQVGFQLSLKWNNWLGFSNRKRKVIPNLRCCTRKSTMSQRHFCLRSWYFKEPFIIWTTKIMWMCIWFERN